MIFRVMSNKKALNEERRVRALEASVRWYISRHFAEVAHRAGLEDEIRKLQAKTEAEIPERFREEVKRFVEEFEINERSKELRPHKITYHDGSGAEIKAHGYTVVGERYTFFVYDKEGSTKIVLDADIKSIKEIQIA